jgi:hypothetical protein
LTLPAEYQINERGMARQGFDLQLTRYDERGWHATQRAAWETLSGRGGRQRSFILAPCA